MKYLYEYVGNLEPGFTFTIHYWNMLRNKLLGGILSGNGGATVIHVALGAPYFKPQLAEVK